jgi:hypothetical protein
MWSKKVAPKTPYPFEKNSRDFFEELKKRIDQIPKGETLTIELDMDGCFLNGLINYNEVRKNSVDLENPINSDMLDFFKSLKTLLEEKELKLQVNICSVANIGFLTEDKVGQNVIKKIVEELYDLQSSKQERVEMYQIIHLRFMDYHSLDNENYERKRFRTNRNHPVINFIGYKDKNFKNSDEEIDKNKILDFGIKIRSLIQYLKDNKNYISQRAIRGRDIDNISQSNLGSDLELISDLLNDRIITEGMEFLKAEVEKYYESESRRTIFIDNDPNYHAKKNQSDNDLLKNVISCCPVSTLTTVVNSLGYKTCDVAWVEDEINNGRNPLSNLNQQFHHPKDDDVHVPRVSMRILKEIIKDPEQKESADILEQPSTTFQSNSSQQLINEQKKTTANHQPFLQYFFLIF